MDSSSLITDNKGKNSFFLKSGSFKFQSNLDFDLNIKECFKRVEFLNISL
jgi:hypothetical protein